MRRPLLGNEPGAPGPPCAVSVPNLLANRLFGLVGWFPWLNVRRLMYQPLIWAAVLRHQTGGMDPAVDAKHLERAADALVDRVRRDVELGRYLFRGMMLVDQAQAVELPLTQACNTLRDLHILTVGIVRSLRSVRHPSSFITHWTDPPYTAV